MSQICCYQYFNKFFVKLHAFIEYGIFFTVNGPYKGLDLVLYPCTEDWGHIVFLHVCLHEYMCNKL